MNNNYFNSKKYMILLVLICLLFAILTMKAFEYMPKPAETYGDYNTQYRVPSGEQVQSDNNAYNNENAVSEEEEEDTDDEDEEDEDTEENTDKNQKSGHIDFSQPATSSNDFIEIPAPPGAVEEEINAVDTN